MTRTNTDGEIVVPNVKISRWQLFWALIQGKADIVIHTTTNPDTKVIRTSVKINEIVDKPLPKNIENVLVEENS
jgi:hypothetical protein